MSTEQQPSVETAEPREHVLKVVAPYFDALLDGSKTFEVRRNDRGFQKGDTLRLWEYQQHSSGTWCSGPDCPLHAGPQGSRPRFVRRVITFVYSGDPRFGGIEPGHVVLGLGPVVRPPGQRSSGGAA